MSPARPVADESALTAVAELLCCPVCGRELTAGDRALRCGLGHSFDIARQGYVSLLAGAATRLTGDSADMLDARAAVQGAGYFEPIAAAVAEAAAADRAPGTEPVIADIGAGTGYYLARALDKIPAARGIAVDIAKPAGRRCARAHPRAAAVVADVWRGLPVGDRVLTTAVSVFAPRNPEAIARCLVPGGRYIVVTPTARHLAELVGPLGMVTVDPEKERRLSDGMAGRFRRHSTRAVEYSLALTRTDIARLVAMGPSAHHATAAGTSIEQLPQPCHVTVSVTVSTYTAGETSAGTT